MPTTKSNKKRKASKLLEGIIRERVTSQKREQAKQAKKKPDTSRPLTSVSSLKEIDNYYRNIQKFPKTKGVSLNEAVFAIEYVNNNMDSEVAATKVQAHPDFAMDPANPPWTVETARGFAKRCLRKKGVHRLIEKHLSEKRDRLSVTEDYLYSKYLAWAELDVSEIIKLKYIKIKGTKYKRYLVCLRKDLPKLPSKVRSGIASMALTPQGDLKLEFINQKAALDQLAKLKQGSEEDSSLKAEVHMHFDKQDEGA